MNRDLKRIIIIDHNPENFQLQPQNAIPIAPYLHGQDRSDHALKDLLPFLEALGKESHHVKDVTKILAEFQDSDGIIRDVAAKYNAKVMALEEKKRENAAKGIGGFVRGRLHVPPRQAPSMVNTLHNKTHVTPDR